MSETKFPYVEIPEHLREVVGEPDEGTRMYRQYGPESLFEAWWYAVCEICGEKSSVSPGGVSMIANVSRAGVHKRMKDGRLTAFMFHVTANRVGLFGGEREIFKEGGRPCVYIPCVECEAWAEQMTGMTKQQRMLEAAGDGDWSGDFIDLSIRKLKKKRKAKS